MRQMRNTFAGIHPLISNILNSIYPSECPVCGKAADIFIHSPVCSACWSQIRRYTGPSCGICALPFISEYAQLCGGCMKKSPPYARVIAYGLYEGVLKEAISRFKFYGLRRLSRPLGGLLPNLPIPEADAIVPVPLTAKGLRQRGFNQSLLLARVVSKKTGIPLNIDTLLKIKETPPQVGLSASERHKNLAGAFTAKGAIKGSRILLVDDVVTTGATAAACSKALLKAGAQEINVLTIARAGML